ncbi:MAG: hypothetical protein Fur0022_35000 [Anaerolineales bacterium]
MSPSLPTNTPPFDYFAYDYERFAETLLTLLGLRGDTRMFPYAMEVNGKGNLDAYIILWLIAHAPPEVVAEADRLSRRT